MQNPRFTINRDERLKYFYQLRDAQNRIILTGEKCLSKLSCLRAIGLVRKYAVHEQAYLRIYGLSTNRFIVRTPDDKEIGFSGQFATMRSKEKSIIEVQSVAPVATIVDHTE
jgi:uncharacterized protein YegP (UPF0339 family)